MGTSTTRRTRHYATLDAPADAVYAVLADVRRWPGIFPPTVHALRESGDDAAETIRLWATAHDTARTWTSRRVLDPDRRRHIRFRQEVPAHPVAEMGGEWLIEPQLDGSTAVVLRHDFRAVSDDAETLDWLEAAVHANSTKELSALRAAVERTDGDPLVTFADRVHVATCVAEAYEFLYRSDLWPERLDHVGRLELTEDEAGLQLMEMDTRARDGAVHTTRSVRVCVRDSHIVYKQLQMPPLLAVHLGRWSVRGSDDGVVVTSAHTIAIAPDAVPRVLGPDSTVAQAVELVRGALSHNSRATLQALKAYAERVPTP